MKKIKTKLVTFVTDNVLLVGLVGKKIFLRACCKIRSGKAASREQAKKVAMRQQRGNSADLRRVRHNRLGDRKLKMPDVAFGGAVLVGRAESFCAWPNPADDSCQIAVAPLASASAYIERYINKCLALMNKSSDVGITTNK